MKKAFFVAALLASLPMSSFAEASFGDNPSIGAKISTLGLGLDYSFTIAESFEGRVGFNYLSRNIDRTWGGRPAHGDVKLSTVNLLVDWFPANNSLRLTGGFMVNNNNARITKSVSDSSGTLVITENGTIDFRKLSPYLGIGWTGKKKDQNLTAAFDLGVLFQGNPKTTVSTPSYSPDTLLPGASCGATIADCLVADNASLYDDAKKVRFWPVLSATVSYVF